MPKKPPPIHASFKAPSDFQEGVRLGLALGGLGGVGAMLLLLAIASA